MAKKVLILLGTRKGAFILESDAARQSWELRGPFCETWPMNHVIADPATGTIYGGGGNEWFGPAVWKSDRSRRELDAFERGPRLRGGRGADQGGLEPGAAQRRRALCRRRAGRPVPQRRRRPVLAPRRRACASIPSRPHWQPGRRRADPALAGAAPRGRATDLGRHLRRRRVPHRRRRRDLGAAQPGHARPTSCRRARATRSSASACTAW